MLRGTVRETGYVLFHLLYVMSTGLPAQECVHTQRIFSIEAAGKIVAKIVAFSPTTYADDSVTLRRDLLGLENHDKMKHLINLYEERDSASDNERR